MAYQAQEVKLFTSKKEQERYENFADLFAILKSTEKLERAYVRDAISAREYEPLCSKLIGQYKTLYESLRDQAKLRDKILEFGVIALPQREHFHCKEGISQLLTEFVQQRLENQICLAEVPDVQQFMAQYNMQCPMASKRLIFSGMPATVEHGKPMENRENAAKAVGETVQFFITTMDSLKLNMVAVDQLYPLLNDLMQFLNKVPQVPSDFDGKTKIKAWVAKLHNMPASHELDDADQRQLLFDLESSYNDFMALF